MNSRIKVFFLPRWFPLPEDPMWGIFVLNHARSVNQWADVFILYADGTNDPARAKKSISATIDGIPVIYMWYRKCQIPLFSGFINTIRMLFCWRRLWKTGIKSFGMPDINHAHILTRMGVFAMIAKMVYATPYVITEHWSRYLPQNFYYTGFFRKIITRIVVSEAGAVMPVSEHLQRAMQKLRIRNRKYIVVPNAVDTGLFVPVQRSDGDRLFTFVHISTFDNRAKNISGILRVVARLAAVRGDFVVKFIGDGVDFEEMKQMAVDLGLNSSAVLFCGQMNPEMVAEELAESDMLLLFSNYENMPVVIPEAFSCGLPVLASRVGGIPEVVDDRCGFLVDPGDEEGLFDLISSILDRKTPEFSKDIIRSRAKELFDEAVVGSRIIDVYKSVLSENVNVKKHT